MTLKLVGFEFSDKILFFSLFETSRETGQVSELQQSGQKTNDDPLRPTTRLKNKERVDLDLQHYTSKIIKTAFVCR